MSLHRAQVSTIERPQGSAKYCREGAKRWPAASASQSAAHQAEQFVSSLDTSLPQESSRDRLEKQGPRSKRSVRICAFAERMTPHLIALSLRPLLDRGTHPVRA